MQRARVMVAGDGDTAWRAEAAGRLRAHGYDPQEATTPEDLMAHAHARVPDAVVIDLDHAGRDAVELLATLRSDPVLCDVPVVAVTERREWRFRSSVIIAGAHDYLRKPVAEAELIARVAAAVGERELHKGQRGAGRFQRSA